MNHPDCGHLRRATGWTFAIAFALTTVAVTAHGLPRMTLLAGSRCSNCHVNHQGGGLRSDMGWYAMNHVGAVTWDKLGLKGLHTAESNTLLDRQLTLGFDLRTVVAKLGRPKLDPVTNEKTDPKRLYVPMQLQPAFNLAIGDQVSLTGSVNLVPLSYDLTDGAHAYKYPGEATYDGWLRWQGELLWPSVRLGMIQPSIGLRHDDHTTMIRSDARTLRPIMAPNYADPGLEVTWEGVHWASIDLGAVQTHNLPDSNPAIDPPDAPLGDSFGKNVSTAKIGSWARVTLSPQFLEEGINTFVGASAFYADGYFMQDAFAGIGKSYWGTLLAEVAHSTDKNDREILNALVQASYPATDWLTLSARLERATTDSPGAKGRRVSQADSLVLGFEVFPMPFFEIRPEYRLLTSDGGPSPDFTFGQYTMQFHVFF